MSFASVALMLLQAAAVSNATASAADTAPSGQRVVGVSASSTATVLAPVRILREPATGAVKIDGKKAEAQSRRDDAGTLWIEFS